jgi:hypothetical protein
LDSNVQESEPFGRWRLMPTAGRCWPDTSQMPSDSRTCERSASITCETLTLSAADSPARTSRMLASERESTASAADCGPNTRESFASYDPASSSWRTSQLCLDGEWSEFSETWPRAGMTQNGIAFQREPLAPIFYATECLSSPLVPSAVSVDHKGAGRDRLERGANNNLRDYFAITWNTLYPPVAMVEYLMGYPAGWTALEDSETPSSRKSRNGSEGES